MYNKYLLELEMNRTATTNQLIQADDKQNNKKRRIFTQIPCSHIAIILINHILSKTLSCGAGTIVGL